jgi:hypothetical protein
MFSQAQTPPIFPARRLHAAAAAAALLLTIFIGAVAARFALEHNLAWLCPVRSIFHIPCPSCGTTRALSALSRGDFLAAFRFNPLAMMAIPGGLILLFFRNRKWTEIGWPLFLSAVALNWLYVLFFLPP